MLAPGTLEPKLIIQELWKQKLDWNEQLPPDLIINRTIGKQLYINSHLLKFQEGIVLNFQKNQH